MEISIDLNTGTKYGWIRATAQVTSNGTVTEINIKKHHFSKKTAEEPAIVALMTDKKSLEQNTEYIKRHSELFFQIVLEAFRLKKLTSEYADFENGLLELMVDHKLVTEDHNRYED